METWEQILLGGAALILLFLFWPGVKVTMEKSRQAENRDWMGAVVPVCLVVFFIVLLIIIARA